jgi:MraZ protein
MGSMLLTGTFHRSLDEKLRFAIPRPLRDGLLTSPTSVLYVAPGTDGSLALYAESSFSRLAEKLEHGSPNAREVRAFSRLFYAQVQRVEVDKQGRVRLPVELAEMAALRKEIVLVGVRDHLEIWDAEQWQGYLQQTQPHYDQLAERAFQRNPAAPAATGYVEPMVAGSAEVDARPAQPR